MVDRLVLVNGLPGSGKTSLATRLAPALEFVLIGKDALKEAMSDAVTGVPSRAFGSAAAQAMWELAAATPGGVMLESWWFKPRDLGYVIAGLDQCGTPPTVELWCDVPSELALDRYRRRRRAPVHEDDLRLTDSWPQWTVEAEPLGVGQTLVVKTDRPIDVACLCDRITAVTGWPASNLAPPA